MEGRIRDAGLPHTPDRGRWLFDRAQVAQWAATRGLATQAGFLAEEQTTLAKGLQVGPLLRAGGIWRDAALADLPGVMEQVVTRLPGVTPPVRQLLSQRLRAKGGVTWAPVGGGFALPHPAARIALGRESGTVALILLREPLVFPEPIVDDTPVTKLLFFIAPSPRAHLDLLGRLSRLLARGPFREALMGNATDEALHAAVAAADAAQASGAKGGVSG